FSPSSSCPQNAVKISSSNPTAPIRNTRRLLWWTYPINSAARLIGYVHHKSRRVFLIGAVGLLLLIFTAFWGHELLGENGEVLLTVLGSSIIAFGHIRNYQLRRQEKCSKPHNQD
ncbi:MAG: MerC domain-containing protein, partial [Lentilitoribacter sp.]